jgi:predicted O-methyltransferase YrrM
VSDPQGWLDGAAPGMDRYLESLLPERPPVLKEMEELAEAEGFPHVGPQVGVLLELLARAVRAERVFELGSGFGYSAAWFTRGMNPQGRIVLTDLDEKNRERALDFLRRLGAAPEVDFRVGDAVRSFEAERGPFDIVFADIDKEEYPRVVELAHARLRSGGLLIVDNALWFGRVNDADPDAATEGVLAFNDALARHDGFLQTIVPLRDGVAVALRTD